jgi:hypothetical protein
MSKGRDKKGYGLLLGDVVQLIFYLARDVDKICQTLSGKSTESKESRIPHPCVESVF